MCGGYHGPQTRRDFDCPNEDAAAWPVAEAVGPVNTFAVRWSATLYVYKRTVRGYSTYRLCLHRSNFLFSFANRATFTITLSLALEALAWTSSSFATYIWIVSKSNKMYPPYALNVVLLFIALLVQLSNTHCAGLPRFPWGAYVGRGLWNRTFDSDPELRMPSFCFLCVCFVAV